MAGDTLSLGSLKAATNFGRPEALAKGKKVALGIAGAGLAVAGLRRIGRNADIQTFARQAVRDIDAGYEDAITLAQRPSMSELAKSGWAWNQINPLTTVLIATSIGRKEGDWEGKLPDREYVQKLAGLLGKSSSETKIKISLGGFEGVLDGLVEGLTTWERPDREQIIHGLGELAGGENGYGLASAVVGMLNGAEHEQVIATRQAWMEAAKDGITAMSYMAVEHLR